MAGVPVRDHLTFSLGEDRGIGSSCIDDIELRTSNLAGDPDFDNVVNHIKEELI